MSYKTEKQRKAMFARIGNSSRMKKAQRELYSQKNLRRNKFNRDLVGVHKGKDPRFRPTSEFIGNERIYTDDSGHNYTIIGNKITDIGQKAITYNELPKEVKKRGLKRKYLPHTNIYIYGTKTYFVKKNGK